MFEIKVTVEIPGIPEAINNLAEVVRDGRKKTTALDAVVGNPAVVHPAASAPAASAPAAPAPAAPAPAAPAPTASVPAASAPVEIPAAEPESQNKSYTLDDLSRAGAALVDQGKMPQLLDLLSKYGVQAVTQLDSSVYPAFAENMKALGAQL